MADDLWRATGQGVTVARVPTPSLQILRLRGFDEAVLEGLDRCLSIHLPRAPNQARGAKPRAIGLAPGEWMITGSDISGETIVSTATRAEVAHVADLAEGQALYCVSGPRARDLIAKGCSIDLHPRVFGAGRAAQSVLAQVFILIDQPSDDSLFHIYAEASYTRHLDLWFSDAVLEFQTQDAE